MKYRRYAAYKESGVEWLGEVPAHWEVKRLRHCCQLRNEKVSALEVDLPYLGLENIESGSGKTITAETGTEPEGTANCYYPGDVLFGKLRPYLAKVHESQTQGICTTELLVLQPLLATSTFLKYYLLTDQFIRIVDSSTYGAKMPRASWEFISNMTVPVPAGEEQCAIAAFLDRETAQIDALIARQERLLAVLQEKRQALISHAVTKGLDPQAAMKESGVEWLGEVPSHWEVKRLKHIAHVQTGVAKGRDLAGQPTMQVPYLRVANVQDGYLDLTDVATIEIAVSELERYRLQPGDVLMNEGGDNDKLGRGHVWRGEVEVCIHQNHVFAVRPHGVDPEWLSLVTGADYAKFYFYSFAKQSTNLASISSSNLRELPILCPPAAERDAIRSYIAVETALIDQLMQNAEAAVAKLQERRAALISAAVTGKIDVRGLPGRALPEGLALSTGVTG